MDWEGLYAFPTFLPRNYQWRSAFDGKTYNSRYALIGSGHAVADRADISDGVNEHGLSVQKLTFSAGKDHFAQSRKASYTQIAPFEFPLWAMTQFDSVSSLLAALPTLEIMNDQEAVREYGEADLHFAAADPTGRFVIIEPLSMPMRVIENPLGVVTNAGDFQKEAAKLADYMTLLPEYAAGRLPYNSQHVSTGDFFWKKAVSRRLYTQCQIHSRSLFKRTHDGSCRRTASVSRSLAYFKCCDCAEDASSLADLHSLPFGSRT